MSRRFARHVFLGLGSLALATTVVLAPRTGTRLSASQNPPPSFEYVTVWSSDRDPQTQALYQGLANAIAPFAGVPNARAAYYSFYNDGVNWAIGSWAATVYTAAADGQGGYNVTLLVGPNFTQTPQDFNRVAGDYTEIFNVAANGAVTYLSSQDPDGSAGGRLGELCH